MEIKDKKHWMVPELVVLVRRKPEEAVLTGCKHPGSSTGDANILDCKNADGTGACQPQNFKS